MVRVDMDLIAVGVERLAREDVLIMTPTSALVEKALVFHGCNPVTNTDDIISEVEGRRITSVEDLTQILTKLANSGARFKVRISRVKGAGAGAVAAEEDYGKIERFVFEIKRDSVSTPFGIRPVVAQGDFVHVESVDGLAKQCGIMKMDRILYMNGEPVMSVADFDRISKGQFRIVVYIVRGAKAPAKLEFQDKVVTIQLPFESGDMLGLKVDNSLNVTSIQAGSIAEDKFELKDRILEINGTKVKDSNQFYTIIGRLDSDLYVNVLRKVAQEGDGKKPPTMLVMISLVMTECEPLGLRPDEKMLVSSIQKSSRAEGKFELGDVIKTVNGIPVMNTNDFFRMIEKPNARKRVNIVVERSTAREEELEMRRLPPSIEKIIERKAGFDYIMVNVVYTRKGGRPFGLQMANVTSHKVVVPEVSENTVAGDYFKVYDRVLAINGSPVSDSDVAKKIIKDCRACFLAVIERPISVESVALVKKEVDDWKAEMARPKNLEEMPIDVQKIVMNLIKRREGKPEPKLMSILRRSGARRNLTFKEKHTEFQIQSDIPPTKRLRSCK